MRLALLLLACATQPTNGPSLSRDSAQALASDRRYAHDSSGQIILGPSYVDQRVQGQTDAAGNVHVLTDRWFLERAHDLTSAQLALAELARRRSASPEVRQLALQLGWQSAVLDGQVRDLARQRHFSLPKPRPRGQIAALSGANFDRAFMAEALSLGKQQLALWDELYRNAPDRQLQQLAITTLPRLHSTQAAATSVRM
jgi:predicted outer membrane protein